MGLLLGAFSTLVRLISGLSSIAGWFHDRAQRDAGALDATAAAQHEALKTMQAALQTARTSTPDELRTKLRDGEL